MLACAKRGYLQNANSTLRSLREEHSWTVILYGIELRRVCRQQACGIDHHVDILGPIELLRILGQTSQIQPAPLHPTGADGFGPRRNDDAVSRSEQRRQQVAAEESAATCQ
ncbi:hypothetical protein D9M71_725340 [compost metagenome]